MLERFPGEALLTAIRDGVHKAGSYLKAVTEHAGKPGFYWQILPPSAIAWERVSSASGANPGMQETNIFTYRVNPGRVLYVQDYEFWASRARVGDNPEIMDPVEWNGLLWFTLRVDGHAPYDFAAQTGGVVDAEHHAVMRLKHSDLNPPFGFVVRPNQVLTVGWDSLGMLPIPTEPVLVFTRVRGFTMPWIEFQKITGYT